jgi:hypothetical protein
MIESGYCLKFAAYVVFLCFVVEITDGRMVKVIGSEDLLGFLYLVRLIYILDCPISFALERNTCQDS